MIALRLPAVRPAPALLSPRWRARLAAVAWGARWFALGLALGAGADLAVRLSLG